MSEELERRAAAEEERGSLSQHRSHQGRMGRAEGERTICRCPVNSPPPSTLPPSPGTYLDEEVAEEEEKLADAWGETLI